MHFDHRKRRVRRSLGTRSLADAIARRDALLLRIAGEGEFVPERAGLPAWLEGCRAARRRRP